MPAVALCAGLGEWSESCVVDEVDAHVGDDDVVDGERGVGDVAGDEVGDAVAAEDGDLSFVEPGEGVEGEAGESLERGPGALGFASGVASGADEEDVAGLDGEVGVVFGGLEVVDGDGCAGFEPVEVFESWDVEEDASGGDAVLEGHDGVFVGAGGADVGGVPTVVHFAAVEDVAEGVDVSVGHAVGCDGEVVAGGLDAWESGVVGGVAGGGHVVGDGVGVVGGGGFGEFQGAGDGDAVLDE